nr:Dynein heavy chain like [Ipomoea batatas]
MKTHEVRSVKSSSFVKTSVTIQRKLNHSLTSSNFAIRAEYKDQRRAGGSEFIVGFLLGGAIFGTLGYVFAPQIRRSLLNEDESGF